MSMQKRIVHLMTAVFLAVVIFLCAVSLTRTHGDLMSFQVPSGEGVQTVSLWEKEDGRFYVFLPAYADRKQVKIDLHTQNPLQINGIKISDGMDCSSFSLDTPYPISWRAWGRLHQREIVFMQSANVPAMYIDTHSGSMDHIHQEKGNKETGKMVLYQADGTMNYHGALESMQGRGNYSWTALEKKPYSIKLTKEADLLGLGAAQRWILLADADDSSAIRNKFIYDFADSLGLAYSPDTAWVDLYLNGEYAGLYLLSERNEVHPQRVDIAEEGSFLVSLERHDRIAAQNYPYVATDAKQYLRVHSPIQPSESELQEMKAVWQSVENAILAEDDTDPVTGKTWIEQIDLGSWVKKYLIEEVFVNGDACYISQFFYRDGNSGMIYAGPVWDYDHTMGTEVAWQLMAPNTLYANRLHVKDGFDSPWFYQLYRKDLFFDRMTEVYQTECLPLLEVFLEDVVDGYIQQIENAFNMNQIRWRADSVTIQERSEYIRDFMKKRTAFLSSIWIDRKPYYLVKADHGMGGFYGYFAVSPGNTLKELPDFADTENQHFAGWYYEGTNEPFDPEKPITADVEIYAKWQDKPARLLGQVGKLLPLGILLLCLGLVLLTEVRRWNLHFLKK